MTTPFPTIEVPQPALVQPAVGTLLNTFEPVPTDDPHWELGYHFPTWGSCIDAFRWGPCSGAVKEEGSGSTTIEAVPITVYAPFRCSTFGMNEDDYRQAARDALKWMGGSQLEAELWDGLIARQNGWPTPYLMDPATVSMVGSGAVFPWPMALVQLQKGLRACSGEVAGVIHASAALVGLWIQSQAVRDIDGKLYDGFGNLVIAGAGYSGNGTFADQVLSFSEDGGAPYTISVTDPASGSSETTAPITQGGGPASIQAALDALTIVEPGELTVGGADPNFTITFTGRFAGQPVLAVLSGGLSFAEDVVGGEVETWGQEYAFATDYLDVRVGEVQILDPDNIAGSVDRSTNTVELIAEATMSAVWGRCCHLGVIASLSDACTYPTEPAPGGGE